MRMKRICFALILSSSLALAQGGPPYYTNEPNMKLFCFSFILASPLSSSLLAQTATLRGQVTDESGLVVSAAKIVVGGPAALSRTATAAADGGC
jgi:hypothetical protein